jgi:hypothetical protein
VGSRFSVNSGNYFEILLLWVLGLSYSVPHDVPALKLAMLNDAINPGQNGVGAASSRKSTYNLHRPHNRKKS